MSMKLIARKKAPVMVWLGVLRPQTCIIIVKKKIKLMTADFVYGGLFLERIPHDKRGTTVFQINSHECNVMKATEIYKLKKRIRKKHMKTHIGGNDFIRKFIWNNYGSIPEVGNVGFAVQGLNVGGEVSGGQQSLGQQ